MVRPISEFTEHFRHHGKQIPDVLDGDRTFINSVLRLVQSLTILDQAQHDALATSFSYLAPQQESADEVRM